MSSNYSVDPSKRASLSHDQMQALVTERILDYHESLCKNYGLKRVSDEPTYGVTVDCTGSGA